MEEWKSIKNYEDYIYWINTNSYSYLYSIKLSLGVLNLITDKGSIYKVFSSKELAEEWIIYNKPCLSVNDFINTLKLPGSGIVNPLKEIVKNKLNENK